MSYRLKTKGSRWFGRQAKQRMALEKQMAFEVSDAHGIMNQGFVAQVKWLWINRMGYHTFFRGVYLLIRMRLTGRR
jgi:hypothetical protein